jgi:hypothetical protein
MATLGHWGWFGGWEWYRVGCDSRGFRLLVACEVCGAGVDVSVGSRGVWLAVAYSGVGRSGCGLVLVLDYQ